MEARSDAGFFYWADSRLISISFAQVEPINAQQSAV
jgi:hypothetical protein